MCWQLSLWLAGLQRTAILWRACFRIYLLNLDVNAEVSLLYLFSRRLFFFPFFYSSLGCRGTLHASRSHPPVYQFFRLTAFLALSMDLVLCRALISLQCSSFMFRWLHDKANKPFNFFLLFFRSTHSQAAHRLMHLFSFRNLFAQRGMRDITLFFMYRWTTQIRKNLRV